MRKLVIILITLIAMVTFIRALDDTGNAAMETSVGFSQSSTESF